MSNAVTGRHRRSRGPILHSFIHSSLVDGGGMGGGGMGGGGMGGITVVAPAPELLPVLESPPLVLPVPESPPLVLPVPESLSLVPVVPSPVGGGMGGGGMGGGGMGAMMVVDSSPMVVDSVVGGGIGAMLSLAVPELSSSPHAGPLSDSSSAPTAGRTRAGPAGGGVGRMFFEAM
ncbi:MAG: hypothetical protein AAGF11_02275 [Myxococcota bacterium]